MHVAAVDNNELSPLLRSPFLTVQRRRASCPLSSILVSGFSFLVFLQLIQADPVLGGFFSFYSPPVPNLPEFEGTPEVPTLVEAGITYLKIEWTAQGPASQSEYFEVRMAGPFPARKAISRYYYTNHSTHSHLSMWGLATVRNFSIPVEVIEARRHGINSRARKLSSTKQKNASDFSQWDKGMVFHILERDRQPRDFAKDVVVSSLSPESMYCFQVRAYGGSPPRPGNWSMKACFETLPGMAPEPPGTPLVIRSRERTLELGWGEAKARGYPVTHYELQCVPHKGPIKVRKNKKKLPPTPPVPALPFPTPPPSPQPPPSRKSQMEAPKVDKEEITTPPTLGPTSSPTLQPTPFPTSQPTSLPSYQPTVSVAETPSALIITATPAPSPQTKIPTLQPTSSPTFSPSSSSANITSTVSVEGMNNDASAKATPNETTIIDIPIIFEKDEDQIQEAVQEPEIIDEDYSRDVSGALNDTIIPETVIDKQSVSNTSSNGSANIKPERTSIPIEIHTHPPTPETASQPVDSISPLHNVTETQLNEKILDSEDSTEDDIHTEATVESILDDSVDASADPTLNSTVDASVDPILDTSVNTSVDATESAIETGIIDMTEPKSTQNMSFIPSTRRAMPSQASSPSGLLGSGMPVGLPWRKSQTAPTSQREKKVRTGDSPADSGQEAVKEKERGGFGGVMSSSWNALKGFFGKMRKKLSFRGFRHVYHGTERTAVVVHCADPSTRIDMHPGIWFEFRVRAHSSKGVGEWSPVAVYHTNTRDALPPDSPERPNVPKKGPNWLQLRWTPPYDNGAEITQYLLEIQRGSSPKNNLRYLIRAPGDPRTSIQISEEISRDSSIPEAGSVADSQGITTPLSVNSTKDLSLSPQNVPVITSERGNVEWPGVHISHLLSNTTYKMQLWAFNSKGLGEESTVVYASTTSALPPDVPEGFSWDDRTGFTVTLSWRPPIDSEVDHYQVERDDWFRDEPFFVFHSGPELSVCADKLLPAIQYQFRVRACNAAGCGKYSKAVNVTTKATGACTNRGDIVEGKSHVNIIDAVANCIYDCAPQYWTGEDVLVLTVYIQNNVII